jgi:hypothetical protein
MILPIKILVISLLTGLTVTVHCLAAGGVDTATVDRWWVFEWTITSDRAYPDIRTVSMMWT